MPYTISVNDIVQITVVYEQTNVVRMFNTFHYRLTTPATLADGQAAINAIINEYFRDSTSAHWGFNWLLVSTVDTSIRQVRGQRIWPIRNRPEIVAVSMTGVRATDSEPALVQWSITRQGDVATRGGAGGIRVPGIGAPDVIFGQLTAQFMVDAGALASFAQSELVTGNPVATWTPIIFKRALPNDSQMITVARIEPDVRSQRSRIVFRGI